MDYNVLLEEVRAVLLRLRPELVVAYGTISYSEKADKSVVTELDVKVEKALKERLAQIAPDIGFYGEETIHESLSPNSWIIDPIDGTNAFIRGIPECANLVALALDYKVQLGIVYNFVTDEFFHAIRGQGAFRNGERIHVIDRPAEHTIVMLESNPEKPGSNEAYDFLASKVGHNNIARNIMSGDQMCRLAEGKLDAIISKNGWENIWDIAADSIIVEEAGGIVRNLGSDSYDVRNVNFMAASPAAYKLLKDLR